MDGGARRRVLELKEEGAFVAIGLKSETLSIMTEGAIFTNCDSS